MLCKDKIISIDCLIDIVENENLNEISAIYIYEQGYSESEGKLKNTILHAITTIIGFECLWLRIHHFLCLLNTPLYMTMLLFFAIFNGKVKSVNLNTMQPNWVYDEIKSNVFVSPAIIKDRIIVNSGYDLNAINAKNGQWITRITFGQMLPLEPVVSDDNIFVVDEKGNAFCFDKELDTKWQFEVNNYISDTRYDKDAKVNIAIEADIQIRINLSAGEKLIVLGDAKHIIGIDKKNGEMK